MSPELAVNKKERFPRTTKFSVGTIICDPEHQHILLLKNIKTQKWAIPAGGVEQNPDGTLEPLWHAANREIQEEFGIGIHPGFNEDRPDPIGLFYIEDEKEPPANGHRQAQVGLLIKLEVRLNIRSLWESARVFNLKETDDSKVFSAVEVVHLIQDNQIYKPKFNNEALAHWLRLSLYHRYDFLEVRRRKKIVDAHAAKWDLPQLRHLQLFSDRFYQEEADVELDDYIEYLNHKSAQ